MTGPASGEPAVTGPVPADGGAGVIETHISVVFFVGDRAYKLKKAVHFPFADLHDPAVRSSLCHREVELNRRLAPDVYLGVATVLDVDGTSEDLVVMRRLPASRRLSALVRRRDPDVAGVLADLARLLAAFHRGADRSPTIDRAGSPEAVAGLWHENFAELAPFAGRILDAGRLERAARSADDFLAGRAVLFEERVAAGAVCDGHGDLQADDVFCLPDGPRVIDCIEFDDGLRHGDVADDVAFLVMDLERLGAGDLARSFVHDYEAAAATELPAGLLDMYIAYRAQVRAKVAALRWAQQAPGSVEAERSAAEAAALLELCIDHLEAATVTVVAVGGLPATGKTTVAAGIGAARGWTVLRSDVVRKELVGLAPTASAEADVGAGLYTPAMTERVYDELVARAEARLARGESVVIDASFTDARQRSRVVALAERTRARYVALECRLAADEARQRLDRRRAAGHDASDATPAVADALAAAADPWPTAIPLDTSAPPDEVLEAALGAIAASPVDDSVRDSSAT